MIAIEDVRKVYGTRQGPRVVLDGLNLKVAKIVPEESLLLIEGGVPGSRNSVVTVKGAVKKKNGGKPAPAKK